MSTPILTLSIAGDGLVNALSEDVSWNNGEQIEEIIKINAADGETTVDLTKFDDDDVKLMVFTSDDWFTVKINVGGQIIEQVTKKYLLEPSAAFVASITALTLLTTNTSKITINSRIYGEAASS